MHTHACGASFKASPLGATPAAVGRRDAARWQQRRQDLAHECGLLSACSHRYAPQGSTRLLHFSLQRLRLCCLTDLVRWLLEAPQRSCSADRIAVEVKARGQGAAALPTTSDRAAARTRRRCWRSAGHTHVATSLLAAAQAFCACRTMAVATELADIKFSDEAGGDLEAYDSSPYDRELARLTGEHQAASFEVELARPQPKGVPSLPKRYPAAKGSLKEEAVTLRRSPHAAARRMRMGRAAARPLCRRLSRATHFLLLAAAPCGAGCCRHAAPSCQPASAGPAAPAASPHPPAQPQLSPAAAACLCCCASGIAAPAHSQLAPCCLPHRDGRRGCWRTGPAALVQFSGLVSGATRPARHCAL